LERTTSSVKLVANFGREGKPETKIAKDGLETFAEMIGTTRLRVSIEVHSSLLNLVLHEEPHIET
jgi:hypothetical protein